MAAVTICPDFGAQENKVSHRFHYFPIYLPSIWASLVAQRLKYLPAMPETCVRSLGREDPLEKGMATHCSILTWTIPMDRKVSTATVHRLPRVGHD